ncbi:phospholipid phosphatase-related protein type 5-like isoform X2 [Ptychodera flava]|uniref:phospholipid phosphatase-related protein type 5-like isoform X2 n=1 Tax=Ptychodera flava TaxID=63121 RepID=UPI003969C3E1
MAEMQHEFRPVPTKPSGPVVTTNNRLLPCFLVVDCIIVAAVVVLWSFLEFFPQWFGVNNQVITCGDSDYSKPIPEEDVPAALVYTMVFLIPFVVILFGEASLSIYQIKVNDYINQEKTVKSCGMRLHPMLRRTLRFTGMLVLGGFTTWIFIRAGQFIIGRPTPYFLTVCDADCTQNAEITQNTDCSGCTDEDEDKCTELNKARMSFPNLYSALTSYAAVYCGLYISSLFTVKLTRLTKPLLVLGMLALAYMAGLDEVAKYRCHWTDIIIGYTIGISVAAYLGFFVVDYFKGRPQYSIANMPMTLQDTVIMNPMHPTNKNSEPVAARPPQSQHSRHLYDNAGEPEKPTYTYDGSMGKVTYPKGDSYTVTHQYY